MNNKEYIQGLESMRQHAISERRNYDTRILDEAIKREKDVIEIGSIRLDKEDVKKIEALADKIIGINKGLKDFTTDELVKELASRNGALIIKKDPAYENMSDYGKCVVKLIDCIGELKAAGYRNKQLVDMLEEHIKDDISKHDIRVIKEIFENEIGCFER